MADRIAVPMSPELLADRLHLCAFIVQRTLQNFRPEQPEIHDRMLVVVATLKQLSAGIPSDLSACPASLQTVERYLHLTVHALSLCAARGYRHNHVTCQELLRVASDVRAIQSYLLHVVVTSGSAAHHAAA